MAVQSLVSPSRGREEDGEEEKESVSYEDSGPKFLSSVDDVSGKQVCHRGVEGGSTGGQLKEEV